MKHALLAATLLCGLASAAQAATYTFVNPVYDQFTIDSRANFIFGSGGLRFAVSNAAVSRGSFNYAVPGGQGYAFATGDVADFIDFSGVGEEINPTIPGLHGNLVLSASFSEDGSVTRANVAVRGVMNDLTFSGSSASFGGTFGGDAFTCGGPLTPCRVTGALAVTGFTPATTPVTAVPEPASLAVLALSLFSIAATRRR